VSKLGRVRGSEFVGHATPARTVEDAESFVDAVREAYPDATHNVPAYRVRADPLREWASDDGEPGDSAGKPSLNVRTDRVQVRGRRCHTVGCKSFPDFAGTGGEIPVNSYNRPYQPAGRSVSRSGSGSTSTSTPPVVSSPYSAVLVIRALVIRVFSTCSTAISTPS